MIASLEAPEGLRVLLLAPQLLETGAILGQQFADPDLGIALDLLLGDAEQLWPLPYERGGRQALLLAERAKAGL